ncbi:MAG: hypothetical protein WC582_01980 [Patescibacteria group bacterium]
MSEKFPENYEHGVSFEAREGYNLEKFSSEDGLHKRMEEIRKSNPYEAHGFFVEKEGKFGFYYQLGDSEISTEFPQGIDNSWHSHPDSSISEVIFREEDLPEDVSVDLKILAKGVVETYANVDEISSRKISLMDLINIASHGRKRDLISLPQGLLDIRFSESEAKSLFSGYAKDIDEKWKELVFQIKPQLTEENFQELRIKMVLEYYQFASTKFAEMLKDIGYDKMEQNNFLEILERLGLKHDFKRL